MSTLPTPAPTVTQANAAFWAATAEGRFQLQRCNECDTVLWFPRRHCPSCWTDNVSTFDASGKGVVYSFTVIRKGAMAYKESGPFVIAYVELAEGPRVMTNIVDCDVETVKVGMPVEVVWHDTGQGNALYRFRPVAN
ncbi:MAG: OB-fold domain-containing protein [Ilumatobacteraceae bacterium]|nr:OB-fold domain-containing protein [Ilumatobacteraceae bacterium]